jgi:hypothetical protein
MNKGLVCRKRVGMSVEQVAFFDVLSSSSVGTYGLICPSPGFGYSRHCMARRLIISRMLSLYVSLQCFTINIRPSSK